MSAKKASKILFRTRRSGVTPLIFEKNSYRADQIDPTSDDSSLEDFIDDDDVENEDVEEIDSNAGGSEDNDTATDDSDNKRSPGERGRKRIRIPSDDEEESSKSSEEMIGKRSAKKAKKAPKSTMARLLSSSDSDSEEDDAGNRSGGRILIEDDEQETSDQPSTSTADQQTKLRHSTRVDVMQEQKRVSKESTALELIQAKREADRQRARPILASPTLDDDLEVVQID